MIAQCCVLRCVAGGFLYFLPESLQDRQDKEINDERAKMGKQTNERVNEADERKKWK